MQRLTTKHIVDFADSKPIYKRGESLYRTGSFRLQECDGANHIYVYEVDGSYGDYRTEIRLHNTITASCSCPYPGEGCKHAVAVLLDQLGRMEHEFLNQVEETREVYLEPDEIRQQAIDDRYKRAAKEEFAVTMGDMFKGDHVLETPRGRQYQVTMHDPAASRGHCSCPDFQVNKLGTCKHLLYLGTYLKKKKWFAEQVQRERFPYIDIFWDGAVARPRVFHERPATIGNTLQETLTELFDEAGLFKSPDILTIIPYLNLLETSKLVRIQDALLNKIEQATLERELREAGKTPLPQLSSLLKVVPYPYQEEGIRFCLYKKSSLIGDEMGLGKTLQAIALAVLKKQIFGFSKVLVITLASLKEQWQREIERFSHEKACIISGDAGSRQAQYYDNMSLFKISNYEAALRDVTIISRFKPDLIILDEAQRIKNFETKTAEAVKSLPRQHALVLTGTPLENKLEDVYSIVQFLEPELLSPLWQFAADHFLLSRNKKGKILGYRNLDQLHQKLKPLVVRRRKEQVLDELPEEIRNDYFIEMHKEQAEIHSGYSMSLLPLLNKKFLTPMDLRHIQILLLKMRQVCDSTYLIDRQTHISPKLTELGNILEELVIQNNRKVVIFSEWTTMTALIGKHLSGAGIPFVELSGKVPVKKRQMLIDEFTSNQACKVFLSTDAGGTGLNLQAADSVINFELPWSPAKLNQRIGRVNRIGQKSKCINIINLIAKNSIEERILAGIKLKSDLFDSVFDGGAAEVMFDREKRQEMVNKLREMLGEEKDLIRPEALPAEEIPEDTAHYLNPQVLQDNELTENIFGEEQDPEVQSESSAGTREDAGATPAHSTAQMENVLNQGMAFIGGLLEMATGKKMEATDPSGRMISVDKETGEVTMKFKLPGF